MITPLDWQAYDAEDESTWWTPGRPVVLIEQWSAVTLYASNATPGAGTKHVVAWAYLPDPDKVIARLAHPSAHISRRLHTRTHGAPYVCGQTRNRWACTLPIGHDGPCSWDRASIPRSYGDREPSESVG